MERLNLPDASILVEKLEKAKKGTKAKGVSVFLGEGIELPTGGGVLYDTTGDNTDGAMTQRAVTEQIKALEARLPEEDGVTFGTVTYYKEWVLGYVVEDSMEAEVLSIDQTKLAQFLNENPPDEMESGRVNFNLMDGNWNYWGKNGRVEIPQNEMETITGISVTVEMGFGRFTLAKGYIPTTDETEIATIIGETQLKSMCFGEYDEDIEKLVAHIGSPIRDVPRDVIKELDIISSEAGYNCPNNFMRGAKELKLFGTKSRNVAIFERVGNNFCYQCPKLERILGTFTPGQVNLLANYIGDNLFAECSLLSEVDDAAADFYLIRRFDCRELGSGAFARCNNLKNTSRYPKPISGKVERIGSNFMGDTKINVSVDFPNLQTLGDSFMADCSVFNSPINLPVLSIILLTGSNSSFLNNCNNMTSTVNLGRSLPPKLDYDGGWFSTYSQTAPCYTQGIKIKGEYRQKWLDTFPNKDTSPCRKLIDGGE